MLKTFLQKFLCICYWSNALSLHETIWENDVKSEEYQISFLKRLCTAQSHSCSVLLYSFLYVITQREMGKKKKFRRSKGRMWSTIKWSLGEWQKKWSLLLGGTRIELGFLISSISPTNYAIHHLNWEASEPAIPQERKHCLMTLIQPKLNINILHWNLPKFLFKADSRMELI